jgi:uncharacterized membrane protein HdeD (DUF308 family)
MQQAWWVFLLQGVVGIAYGIVAMAVPWAALGALVTVFGAYCLVEGAFGIAAGFGAARGRTFSTKLLAASAVSIAAGLAAFSWPDVTAAVLVMVAMVWTMLRGVIEMFMAAELHAESHGGWLLGLAGLLSVLFGLALFLVNAVALLVRLVLLLRPDPQHLIALAWLLGGFAVVHGGLLAAQAFRLRGLVSPVGRSITA